MYYRWSIAWSCCHLIHILARPPRRFMRKGRGDREGSNFPSPVPFNPGSRPIFLASDPLFAFFRLGNVAQCCLIFFPYFSRFPPPVHLPPPFFPGSRPPVPFWYFSRFPSPVHLPPPFFPGSFHLSPSTKMTGEIMLCFRDAFNLLIVSVWSIRVSYDDHCV